MDLQAAEEDLLGPRAVGVAERGLDVNRGAGRVLAKAPVKPVVQTLSNSAPPRLLGLLLLALTFDLFQAQDRPIGASAADQMSVSAAPTRMFSQK